MATYSSSTPTYAHGDSSTWTSPASTGFVYEDDICWIRFNGATSVLAGTSVSSATLALSFDTVGGSEQIRVRGDDTEDGGLPTDHAEAIVRTLTTATVTTGDINGLTTVDIDVLSIADELRVSIDGDVIAFRLDDPNYPGTHFEIEPISATLTIEYTLGDGQFDPLEESAGRTRHAQVVVDVVQSPDRSRASQQLPTILNGSLARSRSVGVLASELDAIASRGRLSQTLLDVVHPASRVRQPQTLIPTVQGVDRQRTSGVVVERLSGHASRQRLAQTLISILQSPKRRRLSGGGNILVPRTPRHIQFGTFTIKPAARMTAVEVLRAGKAM